jgi:hypothetical protein
LNSGLGKCPSRFRQRAEQRAYMAIRFSVTYVTLKLTFLPVRDIVLTRAAFEE